MKILTFDTESKGVFLVLFASLAYSLRNVCAKLLFSLGEQPERLLFFCCLFTFIVLCAGLILSRVSMKLSKPLIWRAFLMGILFAGFWLGYMEAIRYISMASATLLFFSFPLFIGFYIHAIRLEGASTKRYMAFVCAICGLIMTFVGLDESAFGHQAYVFGVSAALVGAIMKAITVIMGRYANRVHHANPLVMTCYMTGISTVIFLVITMLRLPNQISWQLVFEYNYLLNVVCFALAIVTFYGAILFIGPVRVAFFNYSELVLALFLAYFILNEVIDIYQIYGSLLLMLGLLIMPRQVVIVSGKKKPHETYG